MVCDVAYVMLCQKPSTQKWIMAVTTTTVLTAALLSTGFISIAPNLILFLFPEYDGSSNKHGPNVYLSMGQTLAAGSLLGDVVLHTLPESMDPEEDFPWILVGFTLFFVMDLVLRSQDQPPNEQEKKDSSSSSSSSSIFTAKVLLNLMADAMHNFTDGVAIGVSYADLSSLQQQQQQTDDMHNNNMSFLMGLWSLLSSSRSGGVATLSILLHEIPHELGDYAILLQSGFTKRQAILAQFGTAVAAMLGAIVGVWAAQTWTGIQYLTAGGFVYLASTSILPQVLQDSTSSSSTTNWTFRFAQLLAFLTGIAALYLVAVLEHDDDHHHHHHGGHHHHHDHHHHHHHDHQDL